MNFPLDALALSTALDAPDQVAVWDMWPPLEAALDDGGVYSEPVAVAALATVRTEVGPRLAPIHEIGSITYFMRMYDITGSYPDRARALGNLDPGDGPRYHGRGLVQLTGKANYRAAGTALGLDLVGYPDLALDPANAARLLVWFFTTHGVVTAANQVESYQYQHNGSPETKWPHVRRLVNGGYNGLPLFLKCVDALRAALNAQEQAQG